MYLSKNSFFSSNLRFFLGYNYFKSDKILIALIITFTLSTALAGYHFGIENDIFDEYAGCTITNIDIIDKEKIIESLGIVKNCKDVSSLF